MRPGAAFGPPRLGCPIMINYVLKRLVQLVPVLFGITLACFFLLRALPGDPATLLLGARGGPEEIALMKQRLGLDLPLWRQYLLFLGDILSGSLGRSVMLRPVRLDAGAGAPAGDAVACRLFDGDSGCPHRAAGAVVGGGARPAGRYLIKLVFTVLLAIPSFWLGLVLVVVLAIWVPLFPTSGYGSGFLSRLHHLTLPAFVIALATASLTIRSLRSGILNVLGSDYVTTARAKGNATSRTMRVHVLPTLLSAPSRCLAPIRAGSSEARWSLRQFLRFRGLARSSSSRSSPGTTR